MSDPYTLIEPDVAALPLVVDSPHSGLHHDEILPISATPEELLSGWDAYVDELFGHAPRVGGTLLHARFPRWLVDANRARDDLDPDLLEGLLPYPLRPSDKARRGMGVLRRLALPGVPVYACKLPASFAEQLLQRYYDPYHAAMARLIDAQYARFGAVWHIDCHSMKSRGNAMNIDNGNMRPDFVVSNRDGETCSAAFIEVVAGSLRQLGYTVSVNWPYKGAELIRAYSDPARGRHSLQVEVNRALYLDEDRFARNAGFAALRGHLDQMLEAVAAYVRAEVDALR